jgi:hypothetical protein
MCTSNRRGWGEGGIYQRASDGKWVASIDLGQGDGKRQRHVTLDHRSA